MVAGGQKIGALGRTYTWEGGGYVAHLHFGMYDDAYRQGDWVTGYFDPVAFRAGDHQWLPPRSLLREPTAVLGQEK